MFFFLVFFSSIMPTVSVKFKIKVGTRHPIHLSKHAGFQGDVCHTKTCRFKFLLNRFLFLYTFRCLRIFSVNEINKDRALLKMKFLYCPKELKMTCSSVINDKTGPEVMNIYFISINKIILLKIVKSY